MFRYRRDATMGACSLNDLRAIFHRAAEEAQLPISDGRRAIILGPPLPPGATSDAEVAVIELVTPKDPTEVAQCLNIQLPSGLRIERAWITRPCSDDENPSTLDEAVYELVWRNAPDKEELAARLRALLAESEVKYTRIREKKTQQFNARALIRDLTLLAHRDALVRVRMTLSVGPQGTIRPEEVLALLGYDPEANEFNVHRIGLQRTSWRHPGAIPAARLRQSD